MDESPRSSGILRTSIAREHVNVGKRWAESWAVAVPRFMRKRTSSQLASGFSVLVLRAVAMLSFLKQRHASGAATESKVASLGEVVHGASYTAQAVLSASG